ncbi:hypothetical protein [Natrialba hulunbeirensis]|nr:hypothetical protein [Natrialba hulunbeirensis]
MVSPEEFFSSFAQISATIVGFVIAISTVLYSIEREKREERTDELRESLNDFFAHNHQLLSDLFHAFENTAPDDYTDDFDQVSGDFDEAVQKAKELKEESDSEVVIIYSHLAILYYSTLRLETRCDVRELKEIIRDFKSSLDALQHDYFHSENQFNRGLYKDLTKQDEDDIPDEYLLESGVFSRDDTNPIVEHLNENRISSPTNPHKSTVTPVVLSGKELYTIRAVVNRLRIEFGSVRTKSYRTLIDYDPHIVQIIKLTIAIIVAGVVIPIAFLFSFPPILDSLQISGWDLFLSQMVLLITTVLIFISTIELLLVQLRPSKNNLSCLSRFLLWIVDKLSI